MVLNQSACVFALGYFLKVNITPWSNSSADLKKSKFLLLDLTSLSSSTGTRLA